MRPLALRVSGGIRLAGCCILLACPACGFKGPLYLPERNATVVTHPAPAATSPRAKHKANQQSDGSPPPGTTAPSP